MADVELIPFDIWTNLAHVKMLGKCNIINPDEAETLVNGLKELYELYLNRGFELDPEKEDVHINVEHYLTNEKGISAAKKMHSGRSRNDQVATDIRLYLRDKVLNLAKALITLIESIIKKAQSEKDSIMPGFTHYQPAMITTAGHWLTAWSQALLRDVQRLLSAFEMVNRSPLGAAASFGTSWSIDREFSAELLGFAAVEVNTLDCICARGEFESEIASVVSMMMNHLATISQDIILLSTPYYNMLAIDDRFVTGSSIMPQKRNPDFAEVIRGKASYSQGVLMSLMGVLKGSMSGYNRDVQLTKYQIMDLFREVSSVPLILSGVCDSMKFNVEEMLALSKKGFMNSADAADWLARKFELPFRECYELLSLTVKYSEEYGQISFQAITKAASELGIAVQVTEKDVEFLNTPSSLINEKCHTGGPSTESIEGMITSQKNRLIELQAELDSKVKSIETARKKCFG